VPPLGTTLAGVNTMLTTPLVACDPTLSACAKVSDVPTVT